MALADDIKALNDRASEASRQGLEHYRAIGEKLNEAKEVMTAANGHAKGAFGAWCEENFGFARTWRGDLMKLASEWERIEPQLTAAAVLSVKGALALLRPAPIKASEVNKLAGLIAHMQGEGPEADVAKRKLDKMNSGFGC